MMPLEKLDRFNLAQTHLVFLQAARQSFRETER